MAASDLSHMFTQSTKFPVYYHILKSYRCLKKVIHQIDSKINWLLLSTSFTAKFELDFALTLASAFSKRFHFKANRKRALVLLKNCIWNFEHSPPFVKSACFYVTISGYFECFQYFNFETNFLEDENLFQKTGEWFFSWKYWKCIISIQNCQVRSQC